MAIPAQELIGAIVGAMKPILKKHWKQAEVFARSEAAKLAQTLELIVELKAAGRIDEQQAKALVEMQKHSMQAVLLAIEGIGLIAAQNAINAAVDAIRDLVNPAIGIPLL